MKSHVFIVFVASVIIGTQALGQPHPSVRGVWRVVEATRSGPNAGTISSPQPSLYIFTASHYSMVSVNGREPRPSPDTTTATADELRAVWGTNFTANAGTYELAAGTLTTRPLVAKNPMVMRPGNALTFSCKIEGDTLWLTSKTGPQGPIENPPTLKLTRVE